MSYFTKFGSITYDIRQDENYETVKNILQRFIVREEVRKSGSMFLNYIVRDGDRPDTIAHRLYGRSDYHWLVLLANLIVNPYWDFPVPTNTLEEYIVNEYPGQMFYFHPNQYIDKHGDTLLNGTKLFMKGRKIYGETSEATGIIHRVDDTHSGISVVDIEGTFVLGENIRSYNEDAKIIRCPVRKIVQDERYAVHHFERNGYPVDPYSRTWNNTTVIVEPVDFENTLLGAYILDGIQTHTVDNRTVLVKENDDKRSIRLIQSRFIDQIIQNFESLISVK